MISVADVEVIVSVGGGGGSDDDGRGVVGYLFRSVL